MAVHSIIYISRQRDGLADADVDAILASAARNNPPQALTGVLLQYAGHFVQALEGPPEALRRTFARIVADPRHRDLTVLERTPVPARRFGDWTMRRLRVEPGAEPAVDAFFRQLVEQGAQADVRHLLALLGGLARRD